MTLNRRGFLASTAAIGTTGSLWLPNGAAWAVEQGPGFARFAVGDATVTVFSDGNLVIPTGGLAINQPTEKLHDFLNANGLPIDANTAQTNPVLIEMAERKILVDVGSGANFQSTAGKLAENMEAAGIDPSEIDTVIITHAHPDHCWGILDDFDENRFYEAEFVVGESEWQFWMAEERVSQVPEAMQAFVVGAQRQLGAIDPDRLKLVADGAEITPGLSAIATPGHTVGHIALHMESAGQRLLLTGDCFNHWAVSFAHPDWHFGFDADPALAVETRKRILDMAASDNVPFIGYHMPWPGMSMVKHEGAAYRWLPSTMVWN